MLRPCRSQFEQEPIKSFLVVQINTIAIPLATPTFWEEECDLPSGRRQLPGKGTCDTRRSGLLSTTEGISRLWHRRGGQSILPAIPACQQYRPNLGAGLGQPEAFRSCPCWLAGPRLQFMYLVQKSAEMTTSVNEWPPTKGNIRIRTSESRVGMRMILVSRFVGNSKKTSMIIGGNVRGGSSKGRHFVLVPIGGCSMQAAWTRVHVQIRSCEKATVRTCPLLIVKSN